MAKSNNGGNRPSYPQNKPAMTGGKSGGGRSNNTQGQGGGQRSK
jgi:hypothetical protein